MLTHKSICIFIFIYICMRAYNYTQVDEEVVVDGDVHIVPHRGMPYPQQDGQGCCSLLQCVAVRCSALQCVLQRVAVCCSLLCVAVGCSGLQCAAVWCYCNTLQHTATHCNTLQHTATHCNTL